MIIEVMGRNPLSLDSGISPDPLTGPSHPKSASGEDFHIFTIVIQQIKCLIQLLQIYTYLGYILMHAQWHYRAELKIFEGILHQKRCLSPKSHILDSN